MKKISNKKIGAVCGIAALAVVAGASFAYFTDRADTTASGTAGTVGIDLASDINLLDADGQNILNPGDMRDGNKLIHYSINLLPNISKYIVFECGKIHGYAIPVARQHIFEANQEKLGIELPPLPSLEEKMTLAEEKAASQNTVV